MAKCMSNNCSLESFWRGWHSSFNRWILRYLYLPMGGRQYRLANVWVVFLFVAAWHDLEPKLLVWALLNGAFYALEAISRAALKAVGAHLSNCTARRCSPL